MYIIPYWIAPIRRRVNINLRFKLVILIKGRNTKKEISNLAKDTKLESIPTKLPLIKPKEKAQISDTINK